MTLPTITVLTTMLEDPGRDWYGGEITKRTGIPAGTLYAVLARLADAGWLDEHWEDVVPRDVSRPRRHIYRMTDKGQILARIARQDALAVLGSLGNSENDSHSQK